MKKALLFVTVISAFLHGCGNENGTENREGNVPQGMVAADLTEVSEGRMPILINVPDSTVGPLELSSNSQGGVDIKVGKNFQVTITEGEGNIEMKKNDIINDDVRKFMRYVVEEPNALIWEWQIEGMEPEFHFYAIIKAGDRSFEVRDVEGEAFSEKAAIQMLEAAKSLRLKAAEKSS